MIKLDQEEKEILEAFESGKLKKRALSEGIPDHSPVTITGAEINDRAV